MGASSLATLLLALPLIRSDSACLTSVSVRVFDALQAGGDIGDEIPWHTPSPKVLLDGRRDGVLVLYLQLLERLDAPKTLSEVPRGGRVSRSAHGLELVVKRLHSKAAILLLDS